MDKEKFDKIEIPLNEEEIKKLTRHKLIEELSRDNLIVAITDLKKQIELDLPVRNAKAQSESQLIELENNLNRINNNIKVYEKQIKTKKMIEFKPKQEV